MSPIFTRTGRAFSRRGFLYISGAAAASALNINRAMAAQTGTPTAVNFDNGTFLAAETVHEITATFDQTEYDTMIQGYVDTADKAWIEATVSIDGTEYTKAGMRLKGNSSLMGLRMNGENGPQNFDNGVGGSTGTGNATPTADTPEGDFRTGGPGGISADVPEGLPWFVRLDKFVDGQNHNGLTELIVRANNSSTSLNEAVALDLLTAAGLASQRAAAVGFSVNGSEPKLRLAIENPNDAWMAEHFSVDGLLFKSEAEGDWSYRGDDYSSYTEAFDLEGGSTDDDAADYAPLIDFMDFLNNSDDTTFIAELPSRLDVDQFAVYKAMMTLINNGDDISGAGNNSYLYYAPDAEQFTVVPWDMNLAFGGMGGMGGGPTFSENGERPDFGTQDGSFTVPADGTPSAMPQIVIDGTPVAGAPTDMIQPGNGDNRMGGMGGMNNPLVSRFQADADFAAMIDEQTTSLRASLYASGVAESILAARVAVLESGALDLVDQSTITSEAESLAAFFTAS
ncbi:CotH kinase family protein [soil metagenome]